MNGPDSLGSGDTQAPPAAALPQAARPLSTGSGASPVLERYLTYKLHMLSKLNDRASAEAYLAGCGLPLAEARSLAAVGSFGELTVNELAFEANLDKAQASRAAQSLMERGYLSKRPNPADARCVILSVTDLGRPVWQAMMGLIDARNQRLFGCLTPAERALLGELLDRLVACAHAGGGRLPPWPGEPC